MSETLIVIPGWGTFDHSYRKLKQIVPGGKEIQVFDYHRKNTKISGIAESLRMHLVSQESGPISMMGHSYGGALALDFAAKYPELIKHLYLVNSEGIYGQESIPQILKSLFFSKVDYWKTDPAAIMHSLIGVIRPCFAYQTSMKAHHSNLIDEAKSIKVPTKLKLVY